MRGIQQNHVDIAKLLVSHGANLQEVNSSHENVFHILALAIADQKDKEAAEKYLAMATWLRTKARTGHPGRLEALLQGRDVREQTPADYLEGTSASEALREIFALPPPPSTS